MQNPLQQRQGMYLQQQQQQQPPNPQQPPPPVNPNPSGTSEGGMSLAGVLHYLQTEWRRWERDRNEWEIERAEMRARIALLEGERRSADNLKLDLSRRVKMLEFALRQERSGKGQTHPPPGSAPTTSAGPMASSAVAIPPSKLSSMQAEDSKEDGKSVGSDAGSDDGRLVNGNTSPPPPSSKALPASGTAGGPSAMNGNSLPLPGWKTGVAAAGRDPKSRQRSRDYLKQCLQEISYLTSPNALNPLPNRPIVIPPTHPTSATGPTPSEPSSQAPPKPANQSRQRPPALSFSDPTGAEGEQPPSAEPPSAVPTLLQRPRKTLSNLPPDSPNQGIPPSIQEAREKEQRVADEAEKRAVEEKEAQALAAAPPPSSVPEKTPTDQPDVTNLSEEEERHVPEVEEKPTAERSAEVSLGEGEEEILVPVLPPQDAMEVASEEPTADQQQEEDAVVPAVEEASAEPSHPLIEEEDRGVEAEAGPSTIEVEDSLKELSLVDESEGNGRPESNEQEQEQEQTTQEEVLDQTEHEVQQEEKEDDMLTAMFRPQSKDEWRNALKTAGEGLQISKPSTIRSNSAHSDEDELTNLTLEPQLPEDEEGEQSSALDTTSDKGSWKPRRLLRGHVDCVTAVAFHQTEPCFASASEDCTIKLWRVDPSELASTKSNLQQIQPQLTFRGHTKGVTSVIFNSTQNLLYSGSLDATIRVWKVPSASDHSLYTPYDPSLATATLVGHSNAVWGLALVGNEGDRVLVSVSADGNVKVWDAEKESCPLVASWGYDGVGRQESENKEGGQSVVPTSVAAVGTDECLVAVGYSNSTIKLFEVNTGKEVRQLKGENLDDTSTATQTNQVITHPSMAMLISAHEDKLIRFFNLENGAQTYVLPAHSDGVTSLCISSLLPETLVSVGHDASLRIWDSPSQTLDQELTLHRKNKNQGILGVALHERFRLMATAGADGNVRLLTWEGRAEEEGEKSS